MATPYTQQFNENERAEQITAKVVTALGREGNLRAAVAANPNPGVSSGGGRYVDGVWQPYLRCDHDAFNSGLKYAP